MKDQNQLGGSLNCSEQDRASQQHRVGWKLVISGMYIPLKPGVLSHGVLLHVSPSFPPVHTISELQQSA